EVEIFVSQVRLVFSQVARDAAGSGDRPGAAAVDRLFFGENPDALRAIDKNPVTVQEPLHVLKRLGKILTERADFLDHRGGHVVHRAADTRVAVREPRAAQGLEDVVNDFALIEAVEEVRKCSRIETHSAVAEQVVADAREFRNDYA